ncbi:N-acetylglucosaminyldiphosphodolichol N-acetylglucosaminyltransferase catalytic subunit alg13 [Myotisia sp. PD_48]|nr:N-acetylglucosaminyldiphosphodolichol N-acetylglucosaminyltransferase catalytic subunit alg13 [Myotisia sp. PD_48]
MDQDNYISPRMTAGNTTDMTSEESQTSRKMDSRQPKKVCFVTVGATASFNSLIQEILSEPFLRALKEHQYTHLNVQYGAWGESLFRNFLSEHGPTLKDDYGITLDGFDFNVNGLKQEMCAAKLNTASNTLEGLVVSHAGSGTILEVLRYGIPLLVVPNPDLMHNHQVELAKQLASAGYVVHGQLGTLACFIDEVERFREVLRAWPPKEEGDRSKKGLAWVMEDELGFVD